MAVTGARLPLSKERILRAAMTLADAEGLGVVTMRRLGSELGYEAMALYKHVANKDEILDEMAQLVITEIEVGDASASWADATAQRARSAREVFTKHSWAIGLFEQRGPTGPASLRYMNDVLGILRGAGFRIEEAAHWFWLIDSFIYGHVVQEVNVAAEGGAPSEEMLAFFAASGLEHIGELASSASKGTFDTSTEFEFGLSVIIAAMTQSLGNH